MTATRTRLRRLRAQLDPSKRPPGSDSGLLETLQRLATEPRPEGQPDPAPFVPRTPAEKRLYDVLVRLGDQSLAEAHEQEVRASLAVAPNGAFTVPERAAANVYPFRRVTAEAEPEAEPEPALEPEPVHPAPVSMPMPMFAPRDGDYYTSGLLFFSDHEDD